MKLTKEQIITLKKLMVNSAKKGNLANSGIVLENGKMIATAESLVVTNNDATAHSERMLVEEVGMKKKTNYTPGLKMVSVVEPCLMCMSACSQAGYEEIAYIIPAKKYVRKIAWMTDVKERVNKKRIAYSFSKPIKLVHLSRYEDEFCEIFEEEMKELLVEK
jgi:tRNA(Arg) A34 adenosine deaminase TadA